jgi:hypothetical protein
MCQKRGKWCKMTRATRCAHFGKTDFNFQRTNFFQEEIRLLTPLDASHCKSFARVRTQGRRLQEAIYQSINIRVYFQAALAAPGGYLSPFWGPLLLAQASESFMIKTEDFSCFGKLLSFKPSWLRQSS